ncbi:hypothetical protein HN358_01345 [Candidatus Uhrbacteria bacterium]|jgi:hypothetical protein|nr:hypothetical protein [Candidatus Uhrbacteria bacterium]MBT7717323.1 hypothetical protein [Candidatus Uhrbacteria bacterium]
MDCLFYLWEDYAQDFLEANLDRRLSPLELNRMKMALIENEKVDSAVMDMMYHAGKDAIDNSDGQWDDIDEDFKNGKGVLDNWLCKEK